MSRSETESERLAKLELRLELRERHIDETLKELKTKVDELHNIMTQAKGAKWAILIVAGLGGALADFLIRFLPGLGK